MVSSQRVSTWCIAVFIGIAVWRRISKKRALQERLHNLCKTGSVLLQWYTLFSVGMLIFVTMSTFEYFASYYFFDSLTTDENLRKIWNYTNATASQAEFNFTSFQEFKEHMEVSRWIETVNALSQVFGFFTVIIVVSQMWAKFILPSRRAAQQNMVWRNHQWHVPKRVNWILWILIVPTVFCIETMRANTKVWGLVTGQSPEFGCITGQSPVLGCLKFAEAEKLELLYAREDLEIACLIQFTAIYAFTRLISSLLEKTALVNNTDKVDMSVILNNTNNEGNFNNHSEGEMKRLAGEYKRLMRLGGFLGLWTYIVAGCVRAIVTILIAIILQFRVQEGVKDRMVTLLEDADLAVQSMTSTTFGLLTVLSVINMVIMSGTYIVTDRIGDANKKFLGARVMLLTSEIAPKVVDAVTVGTPLHTQITPILKHLHFLRFMFMNRGEAEVFKVAILSSACFVTVIMNAVFWNDVNINGDDERGLLDFPTNEEETKTMDETEAPLLDD